MNNPTKRTDIGSNRIGIGASPPPVSRNVLVDLIGVRLAFKRTGVRLYEGLFVKVAAHTRPKHDRGPTLDDVRRIHDEELQHVALLIRAIMELGGDPSAVTRNAGICATAGAGILKVLTHPRATLTHALHTIHIAEIANNDAWETLSDLADAMGQEDMAANFRRALLDGERHLACVRAWLTEVLEAQAETEPGSPPNDREISAP